MHIILFSFLEQHNVIYNSQYGFQKGKSTMHSLIEMHGNCMENKNYGCGIFIDLKHSTLSTITFLSRNWNTMVCMIPPYIGSDLT